MRVDVRAGVLSIVGHVEPDGMLACSLKAQLEMRVDSGLDPTALDDRSLCVLTRLPKVDVPVIII